jgi:hypothetical protein
MTLFGILLAAVAWFATFGIEAGNFWVKIGISVACVCVYALIIERPRLRFQATSLLFGAISAAALYGIFYAGFVLAPVFVPNAHAHVGTIYALGVGSSRVWVCLLLVFVTSPGEEIFWRGFLQERLMRAYGVLPGFLAATALYGAVHVFSGNSMLILSALVAGGFWGLLYAFGRNLAPLIVSHALFTAVIFTLAPIGQA